MKELSLRNLVRVAAGVMTLAALGVPPVVAAEPPVPADAGTELDAYFAEPGDLPYDEETLAEKQEDGWHWRQFRYTSLVYGGEPIRIHAVYAAPDGADAAHPVPAILMTHGIFGAVRGGDPRYWSAVTSFVKAGYAVLFFDWYPNFAHDFKPKSPDEPKPFSTFGKLDYFTPSYRYTLAGNDWKDSLHYQVVMAAKRGISWLQARPEVDGKAIGATGASYGGIFSAMIAGIDKRIVAANPCVYTARFGPQEESYNRLGDKEFQDEAKLRLWQSRFDSYTLLARRPVPVLYTIGANDNVFRVTKAMDCFAAMAGPKHLLIGPNEGHGYWAVPQGIHFFDSVLKKSGTRPAVSNLAVRLEGGEVVASLQATGEIAAVECFVATVFERDPIRGWTGVPVPTWKWTAVPAALTVDGRYEARWPLPVMRPASPREALYRWGEGDRFDPAAPPPPVEADKLQGAIRVFARVTDKRGVQECSPLTPPLLFSDAATAVVAVAHSLPKFEAAVSATNKAVVELIPNSAGNPVATLDLPLPVKAVGKAGYVLWNWRKEPPSAALMTDGVATPTKSIGPAFSDTIQADSFNGFNPLPGPSFSASGRSTFRINGKDGMADKAAGWHGSVAPGPGSEEIQLRPQDDAEHRVTLVMVGGLGDTSVRVSVRGENGAAETVHYVQTLRADNIFQFRFAGPVVLRVEVTSAPFRRSDGAAAHHLTPIGPSALFLD
jgi:dienelactone hydrolase